MPHTSSYGHVSDISSFSSLTTTPQPDSFTFSLASGNRNKDIPIHSHWDTTITCDQICKQLSRDTKLLTWTWHLITYDPRTPFRWNFSHQYKIWWGSFWNLQQTNAVYRTKDIWLGVICAETVDPVTYFQYNIHPLIMLSNA